MGSMVVLQIERMDNINFSLGNILDMKVRNKKDTTEN